MSSTFQLQELLQKEVEIVQELENYLELIQKEINRVEKYLQKNYENDVLPKSEEGNVWKGLTSKVTRNCEILCYFRV